MQSKAHQAFSFTFTSTLVTVQIPSDKFEGEMVRRANSFAGRVKLGRWASAPTPRCMEDDGWRIEDGGWRMEDGGWRMEDGGWGVEERGWRMEDEGWRMEDGSSILHPSRYTGPDSMTHYVSSPPALTIWRDG